LPWPLWQWKVDKLPWTMHHDHARTHLGGTVSPPLVKRRRLESPQTSANHQSQPSPAAIEAGKAQIDDHLTYFLALYVKCSRAPLLPAQPTISLDALMKLYTHHAGSPKGHSFVIHQHDHPKVSIHHLLTQQHFFSLNRRTSYNPTTSSNPTPGRSPLRPPPPNKPHL